MDDPIEASLSTGWSSHTDGHLHPKNANEHRVTLESASRVSTNHQLCHVCKRGSRQSGTFQHSNSCRRRSFVVEEGYLDHVAMQVPMKTDANRRKKKLPERHGHRSQGRAKDAAASSSDGLKKGKDNRLPITNRKIPAEALDGKTMSGATSGGSRTRGGRTDGIPRR